MRGLGKVYSIEELKDLIIPVLLKHGVTGATLFGSYAKGTATTSSDIDLVVVTDKSGFEFTDILADLFDIFGYGNVDLYAQYELKIGSRLSNEINKTGVVLF